MMLFVFILMWFVLSPILKSVFFPTCMQLNCSFFRDRGITLGSLMGATSILELSGRSSRFRTSEASLRGKKSHQHHRHSKPWLFSLCSRLSTDAVRIETAPSLGYFLEAERRAAITYRKNNDPPPILDPTLTAISPDDPQTAPQTGNVSLVAHSLREQEAGQMIGQGSASGYGVPLLLSCLRGQIIGWFNTPISVMFVPFILVLAFWDFGGIS